MGLYSQSRHAVTTALAVSIVALYIIIALAMSAGRDQDAIAQYIAATGVAPPAGPLSANTQKITNLTPAASPGDALSYGQNLAQIAVNNPNIAFVSETHTIVPISTSTDWISINLPSPTPISGTSVLSSQLS